MAFANTVGFNPTLVNRDYGQTTLNGPLFAYGTIVKGRDGHDYIYAKATGAIANAAVAILTEPAMTVATGAGAWTNKTGVALAANDAAWLQRTLI